MWRTLFLAAAVTAALLVGGDAGLLSQIKDTKIPPPPPPPPQSAVPASALVTVVDAGESIADMFRRRAREASQVAIALPKTIADKEYLRAVWSDWLYHPYPRVAVILQVTAALALVGALFCAQTAFSHYLYGRLPPV